MGTIPEHELEDPDGDPGGVSEGEAGFEQLSLDATVTGPGGRTGDPYEPGTQLKIKGERGVFAYRHASVSRAGLVSLHLVGVEGHRAVRPEQVTVVRKRRRTK